MTRPNEWPVVPLGEVLLDIQAGFASGRHNSEGTGLPHLRPMNISTRGLIDRSVVRFVEPALAERATRRLCRGDVLFNNTNSPELVGKTALFEDDDQPAFSNHMTRLRPDPSRLDPGFLALRLHQAWREGWFAAHCNNHVSQSSISRDVLRSFEIELPPLEVQQTIYRLSESIDSRRSSSAGHLASARHAVERLRQAVLAAACSGSLTEDWREANKPQPASAIVASLEESRGTRLRGRRRASATPGVDGELPDGWTWTTVGALVDVATGATPLRKRTDYYDGSIPWVTSGAVNAGVISRASDHITELAIKETNAKVFPAGTLLVAMYGEGQTRGRVAELAIDAATNQAVAALLFNDESEGLRPYLRVFFLENYERIRRLSFGGVQPNLSLGAIRDTPLPLPPAEEQSEIVRRVELFLRLAAELQQRIDRAATHLDRCSQAVLAKAFRGELVVTEAA